MRAPYRVCLASLLVAFVASGCNSGPQLAEVEGTVKVNGQPVDNIQVEFWPTSSGPKSIGVTDAQGRYTLTTDTNRKGAVVGSHKVVLKDVGIMGDKFLGRAGEDVDMTKGKKSRIPTNFNDVSKTPIEKTVKAGEKNQIDITP
jgi:hypothetical protein